MTEVPTTTAIAPPPRSVALAEIETSALTAIVERLDDELVHLPVSTGAPFLGFGGAVALGLGTFMLVNGAILPGTILIGSAILQLSVAVRNFVAIRRLRREAVRELHPRDADRLVRVVRAARKEVAKPGVRLAAAASLTLRREFLLREVGSRLGRPLAE